MKRKISIDEAMISSIGISSNYAGPDTENICKVASQVKDSSLEKIAGIYIDNPTPENIEDFLRKYMYNELTFFPRMLEVGVEFLPSSFDTVQKNHVQDGTGLLKIKVRSQVVELPFMVKDGDLIPFDIIQMEGQRAPYSRENLQKIIINLDKQIEQEEQQGPTGQSPYLGLENYSNPSTAAGFMGDVLSIRDSQSYKQGPGMYVSAESEYTDIEKTAKSEKYNIFPFGEENRGSLEHNLDKARDEEEKEKPTTPAPKGTNEKEKLKEKLATTTNPAVKTTKVASIVSAGRTTNLNSLLEKVASISPISDSEIEAITNVLQKKAMQSESDYFDKLAAEEEKDKPTRRELEDIKKAADFKFIDANSVKHGTFIIFPEIANGDVSLTPAIVLSDTDDSILDSRTKDFKFVYSIDGRIKVLQSGEKFLCKECPEKAFKIKTSQIKTLEQGDKFFAFNGNKVLTPCEVDYVTPIRVGDWSKPESVIEVTTYYECSSLANATGKKDDIGLKLPGVNPKGTMDILTLDNKKFEKMKTTNFIVEKAKEVVLNEDMVEKLLHWKIKEKDLLIATDSETGMVYIKGTITTHCANQEDFDLKNKMQDAGYDVEKVAFALNSITIECANRRTGLFNVVVEYKDTDARFMSLRRQNFNNIKEGKLKALLRIIKFQGQKISEVVYKAKNEPRAVYPIPAECTIEDIQKLQGGALTNVSKEAVKTTFNKYVNPLDIAKTVIGTTVGTMLATSALQSATGKSFGPKFTSVLDTMSKMSAESAELSGVFEKIAQDNSDDTMLDYAKALAISHYFHEKIATVLTDTSNSYPSIKDISMEIIQAKPVLEKFAYDLTGIKVNQSYHGVERIDMNHLSRAITSMDSLYKTACAVDRSIKIENLNFNI